MVSAKPQKAKSAPSSEAIIPSQPANAVRRSPPDHVLRETLGGNQILGNRAWEAYLAAETEQERNAAMQAMLESAENKAALIDEIAAIADHATANIQGLKAQIQALVAPRQEAILKLEELQRNLDSAIFAARRRGYFSDTEYGNERMIQVRQNPPSVVETERDVDLDNLPAEFVNVKVVKSLNKKAIVTAHKNGKPTGFTVRRKPKVVYGLVPVSKAGIKRKIVATED